MFIFLNVLYILAIIVLIIIGIIVLLKGSNKRPNQLFFIFDIFVIFWILSNYLSLVVNSISSLRIIFPLIFIFAICVFYSLVLFSLNFPTALSKKNNLISIIALFAPLYLLINTFVNPSWLITGLSKQGIMVLPEFGVGFSFFTVSALLYFILTAIILYFQYKKSNGILKQQVRFLFIGLIITLIFILIADLITPFLLNAKSTGNFDAIGILFFIGFTSYAILSHHLFDIRVIIKKTVIYSALLLFILFTYIVVVTSSVAIFGGETEINLRVILANLFAAALIIFGYDPMKQWLQEKTDKWLFKGEYNSQEVLSKLSDYLSSVIDLNEALVSMMKTLIGAMRIKNSVTFVLRKEKVKGGENKEEGAETEIKSVKAIGYEITEKDLCDLAHPLIHYFEKKGSEKILITEDIKPDMDVTEITDKRRMYFVLREMRAALAMPIEIKGKIIGIFVLGEKLSGDVFSQSDIDLLEISVKQTAAAIEKARFYEEDQLKSEFVSIASHELLTPTSAIEGYLSMILDERLAKVDKKAEAYLRRVYTSSKRLASLVKDLLNVSRIEGGRIVIQWQAFDIIDLINTVIGKFIPKAKEKGLVLEFIESQKENIKSNAGIKKQKSKSDFKSSVIDRRPIIVFGDQDRTQQILFNLIGNSIKYTEKGYVKVTVNIDEIIRSSKNPAVNNTGLITNIVEIKVIDTGIGISYEDQKHIFEKFFRAGNADKYNANSTGLELYISKNLAELMGGVISLKSQLNKGSEFAFTMKLATSDQIQNFSKKPEGTGVIPYEKSPSGI